MSWKITSTLAAVGTAVLLATGSHAAQPSAPALLVLEKGTLTLAIIDPVTLKVLARVPSGPEPHEVVASDDGTRAYISNYGGEGSQLNIISVVDLVARKALPPINLGALHSTHGLDFAGGKLYFTAETSKVIGRYDPATQQVDWVMGTGQDRTHMVLVPKDLKHIFTTNVRSATISIIDEKEITAVFLPKPQKVWEVTDVPVGRGAEGFDLSPDGKQLWTANTLDSTVTIVDVASKKAIDTFPIPADSANRLKFTPDGRHVVIAGLGAFGPGTGAGPGNLVVLDVATHNVVQKLNLGGGAAGILMDPNGERAFVAVNRGGKVITLSLKDFTVSGELPLSQPDGLAWSAGKR